MTLTIEQKRELVALDQERRRRQQQRRLFSYTPYPKQLEFHAQGAIERERLLIAGNQLGKTWSMGFEAAMHLTGIYPTAGTVFYPTELELERKLALATAPKEIAPLEGMLFNLRSRGLFGADIYPNGWPGHRFSGPIWMWASSLTGQATRDNPQKILVGPPAQKELWGTGSIPRENLLDDNGQMDYAMAQGTPDALDHILVRHVAGGWSNCQFKSYAQGRENWQGPSLDLVWYDEEPPEDIYTEGITRTNATQGLNALTFTPLLGFSKVVRKFLSDEELTPEGMQE